MVVDEDVLEKEDLYILDRIKAFISEEEVIKFAAAKQLLILLERAVWPTYIACIASSFMDTNSNGPVIQESR